MVRTLMLVSPFVLAGSAFAADTTTGRSVAVNLRGGTLNEHHITSTGATVPRPGASQSGGTTAFDLGIQRRDTEIQNSLCRGC